MLFLYDRLKTDKPNLPNQTYQTKPTKPNLPNQTYQTKPTKPTLPNQTYQTNIESNIEWITFWQNSNIELNQIWYRPPLIPQDP